MNHTISQMFLSFFVVLIASGTAVVGCAASEEPAVSTTEQGLDDGFDAPFVLEQITVIGNREPEVGGALAGAGFANGSFSQFGLDYFIRTDVVTAYQGQYPSSASASRLQNLRNVQEGSVQPAPSTRLGAFAATVQYPDGTVGHGVHNAIAAVYLVLGAAGQEQIGTFFNSPEVQQLMWSPIDSADNRLVAEMEHGYWRNVLSENPFSLGGLLGAAVSPAVRERIQLYFDRRAITYGGGGGGRCRCLIY